MVTAREENQCGKNPDPHNRAGKCRCMYALNSPEHFLVRDRRVSGRESIAKQAGLREPLVGVLQRDVVPVEGVVTEPAVALVRRLDLPLLPDAVPVCGHFQAIDCLINCNTTNGKKLIHKTKKLQ